MSPQYLDHCDAEYWWMRCVVYAFDWWVYVGCFFAFCNTVEPVLSSAALIDQLSKTRICFVSITVFSSLSVVFSRLILYTKVVNYGMRWHCISSSAEPALSGNPAILCGWALNIGSKKNMPLKRTFGYMETIKVVYIDGVDDCTSPGKSWGWDAAVFVHV